MVEAESGDARAPGDVILAEITVTANGRVSVQDGCGNQFMSADHAQEFYHNLLAEIERGYTSGPGR